METPSAHPDHFSSALISSAQEMRQSVLQGLKPWHFKPKKSKFRIDQEGRSRKRFNSHHWTPQENRKYAQFLQKFSFLINSQAIEKRKFHLNRIMSKFVSTRSPIQCRSHHQKMFQAFKTHENIIAQFLGKSPESEGPGVSISQEESKVESVKEEEPTESLLVVENLMTRVSDWSLDGLMSEGYEDKVEMFRMEQGCFSFLGFE